LQDGRPLPWPKYIGEKGEIFEQNIWDKIVVLLGTYWGPKKTDPPSLPPQKKNIGPYSVYVEPSHWLHEIFISKTVCHHFSLGLMESMGIVYVLSSNIAWKKNPPFPTPPTQEKEGGPSFHGMTSHYLHGNSNPKIGYYYFWP